ncbi:hypothetical protein PV325_002234 [Microctonus aethiopoides]|nr:hypothetical protein PV325_002234 [Microctonus aethiopoides]
MVGKDGKVESKRDIVRQGFMIKRSQNKKRFTPINYKQRWFVLTRNYLVYYDSDSEDLKQKFNSISWSCTKDNVKRRKERGRIAIESVHVVETATLGAGNGSDVAAGSEAGSGGGGGGGIPPGLPFQVGYREAGQEYTLYLLAAREQDRTEWIRALRAGKMHLIID